MPHQPGLIITTDKFPMAQGEDDDNVNPGMYGRLICEYIKNNLPGYGVQVPSIANEDWGWWIYAKTDSLTTGLCIYSHTDIGIDPRQYVILSAIEGNKKWSWKKLRPIDVSDDLIYIFTALERMFKSDRDIYNVEKCDGFPF